MNPKFKCKTRVQILEFNIWKFEIQVENLSSKFLFKIEIQTINSIAINPYLPLWGPADPNTLVW